MRLHQLRAIVESLNVYHPDTEIRIGDQLECGPYLNASVGGVYLSTDNERLVICANDDETWKEEVSERDMETLWAPSS